MPVVIGHENKKEELVVLANRTTDLGGKEKCMVLETVESKLKEKRKCMFNELSHNLTNFESSRKLELSPSKMIIYCAKDSLFSSQNVYMLVSVHIWL